MTRLKLVGDNRPAHKKGHVPLSIRLKRKYNIAIIVIWIELFIICGLLKK
jgi:hypothetical protein